MPVDLERASKLVQKIVNKAHKDGILSELTPRVVRQKVEQELELDPGTLDEKEYKQKLKSIIQDAVDAATLSGDESEADKEEGSSKGKKRPSPPKTKSKEKKPKKLGTSDNADEDQPKKRKKVATVVPKTGPLVTSEERNKASTFEVKNGGTSSEKKPDLVKLTSDAVDVKYQSDSEMSVLIDEPPPKKRKKRASDDAPEEKKIKEKKSTMDISAADEQVKKLKSLVVACGVRKVWAKELKDCETTSQQISHLRRMLMELGMKSRFSMEQAKAIRKERELAKEIQDVREFAEKHAGEGRASRSAVKVAKSKKVEDSDEDENGDEDDDKDDDDGSDDDVKTSRRPKISAHRSIMAFLGDQSDSD